MGQASDCDWPGLANSTRQAWTVALKGFHSAIWRSHGVMWLVSTNAFEMNVTGKSQISPLDVAAFGVRTDMPIRAPIQVVRPYPPGCSSDSLPSRRPHCTHGRDHTPPPPEQR